MQIHNETVLAFFKSNSRNPNVKKALEDLDELIKKVVKEESIQTAVHPYLEYLEQNNGDDASFTLTELQQIKNGRLKITR